MAKKVSTAVAVTVPNVQNLDKLTTLTVAVTNDETHKEALQYLADIALAQKNLKVDIAALKKPFNYEIAKIDAATKPYKDNLDTKRDQISAAISAYKRRVEAAVEKANAKTIERHEEKVFRKESDAVANGKPLPAIAPPVLKVAPAKTEEVVGARVTEMIVKTWKLAKGVSTCPKEITYQENLDLGLLIPAEYFVLDTARVGKLMKNDAVIPGIEQVIDTTFQVVGQ
jgi:hypothetical protein